MWMCSCVNLFLVLALASKGFLRVYSGSRLLQTNISKFQLFNQERCEEKSYCGFATCKSLLIYLDLFIYPFAYLFMKESPKTSGWMTVLLIPAIILQSVLLTNPTINATGHKTLASPVAPPKSCLVKASWSIHGIIVGIRQMKRPRTIIAADISFLLVGIFFKRRNLEKEMTIVIGRRAQKIAKYRNNYNFNKLFHIIKRMRWDTVKERENYLSFARQSN